MRIGLTGGVGSGKSVVADALRTRGAIIIDSDAISRDILAPALGEAGDEAVQETVDAFGPHILNSTQHINRARLAEEIFADAVQRERLNAIVHPLVRERAIAEEENALAQDPSAVIVHDIPLLIETNQEDAFDCLLVVETDLEIRIARLMATRGWTREEILSRIEAQATDEERRQKADVVIDNSGSIDDLTPQIDRFWTSIVEPNRGE